VAIKTSARVVKAIAITAKVNMDAAAYDTRLAKTSNGSPRQLWCNVGPSATASDSIAASIPPLVSVRDSGAESFMLGSR